MVCRGADYKRKHTANAKFSVDIARDDTNYSYFRGFVRFCCVCVFVFFLNFLFIYLFKNMYYVC
jgi:hypothetical protein